METATSAMSPERAEEGGCRACFSQVSDKAYLPHQEHLLIELVSHFDHLDPKAVEELGDSCEWIVPIGVGKFLREHGVSRITELE